VTYQILSVLIDRMSSSSIKHMDIIPWSCPVISFGDLSRASIGTVGLNPSNREFVDGNGRELDGELRRFHTLRSLGLKRWSDASAKHLRLVQQYCDEYFDRNPYDAWFKRLDQIVLGTGASYYGGTMNSACHLDLIPYATASKWSSLSASQRADLIEFSGDALGLLLQDSHLNMLILNGSSVVNYFQRIARVELEESYMPEWNLSRSGRSGVLGFSYSGYVSGFAGKTFERPVLVVGYNHNIQSSYGVTRAVIDSITDWIATMSHRSTT